MKPALAAKNATKKIPIIISNTSDAVRSGFVASLAWPGGNITGLTSIGGELVGQRLDLLKEVIPTLSRVGFLWSPTSPTTSFNLKETGGCSSVSRGEYSIIGGERFG